MSEFMSRKSIFFGTQVLLAASAGAVHAAEKPLNVVLILADGTLAATFTAQIATDPASARMRGRK